MSHEAPNIFLGVGIATTNQILQAIPIDLVGFMLTAEQVRRELNSDVHILIADQHAWLANNLNKKDASNASTFILLTIKAVVNILRLKNWHFHVASKIFSNETSQSYETLETRDVNHFAKLYNCGAKIGWTFSPKENGVTDESHFDSLHNISTLLIKPGFTLDPQKPRESPYICTNLATRITIKSNEDVKGKLLDNSPLVNAMANHLRVVCRLCENELPPFPSKTPLISKLTWIIDLIIEERNRCEILV